MRDPIERFAALLEQAEQSEPDVPSAFALATVRDGQPSARTMLLRGVDERGFRFFTNYESCKGRELRDNPRAAMCFHWKTLRQQVRIEGHVTRVGAEESDAYFASRPVESQLAAIASDQSRPLESREALTARHEQLVREHGDQPPHRPAHWGGFRLVPQRIEFWKHGDHRLHDRELYVLDGDGWRVTRLQP